MSGLLSISSLQDERDKTEQSMPVTKFVEDRNGNPRRAHTYSTHKQNFPSSFHTTGIAASGRSGIACRQRAGLAGRHWQTPPKSEARTKTTVASR